MGHHYVPQKYLEGFAEPGRPEFVWMYDKVKREWTNPIIKKAAQGRGYYSPEVELLLAREIENPTNVALQKLRRGESVSAEERVRMSMYLAVMMKRGPGYRGNAYGQIPDTLKEVTDELRQLFNNIRETIPSTDPAIIQKRLKEIDEVEKKFAVEPPSTVMDVIRTPWPAEIHIRAIHSMTWTLVPRIPESIFITTDNPFFIFECYGVGRTESEFTIPLSSDWALLGSWQPGHDLETVKLRPQITKQVNQRLASKATRFIFAESPQDWIEKIANKQDYQLNRINWSDRPPPLVDPRFYI